MSLTTPSDVPGSTSGEVVMIPVTIAAMSALGHKQTSRDVCVMSVISLKGDIHLRGLHVCLVPLTDLLQRGATASSGQWQSWAAQQASFELSFR
jgi:hypothetical protein